MRSASTPIALSLSLAAALLAACADTGRISAPRRDVTPSDPTAAKQGTTSSRILFTRDRQLFSMDDDGTRVVQLVPGITVSGASWAPDGKGIIFSSNYATSGQLVIYSMNGDGSGITQLTHPPEGQSDYHPRAVGKLVVFQRLEPVGVVDVDVRIWIVDPATLGETQLTSGPDDTYPSGAPSGKLFAFARGGDVYVYELATGAITNLTKTPALLEFAPAWAPGGKQIAYSRPLTVDEHYDDLFVMNADGTNVTPLTNTPDESEERPFWSPDGKRIAFMLNHPLNRADVWVMNADGTGRLNLTPNTPGIDDSPQAWAR